MANSGGNDSPLVRLAVAILDDPHGITTEAWEALIDLVGQNPPDKIQRIIAAIDGSEGRVYLPEGWNDGG